MSDDEYLYDPIHNHCKACFQLAVYQLRASERSHAACGPGFLSRKSSAWLGDHKVTVWIPATVEGDAR